MINFTKYQQKLLKKNCDKKLKLLFAPCFLPKNVYP